MHLVLLLGEVVHGLPAAVFSPVTASATLDHQSWASFG